MRFQVGQLVWIISSIRDEQLDPPALVIDAYEDMPRVFLNNPEANEKWLEAEDISFGWVYDIIYMGRIEVAVSPDWLRPCEPLDCIASGSHD